MDLSPRSFGASFSRSTIVPFTGGDPTANTRVYEQDRSRVRPFKREWNYRAMPLGLHDPYDLELQVACHRFRDSAVGGGTREPRCAR